MKIFFFFLVRKIIFFKLLFSLVVSVYHLMCGLRQTEAYLNSLVLSTNYIINLSKNCREQGFNRKLYKQTAFLALQWQPNFFFDRRNQLETVLS